MKNSDIHTLLMNICFQLKLGDFIRSPEKLTGGALHENWKITSSKAVYVIKILNSHIAQKPDIRKKYEETEQIASTFQSANIPAVAALKFDSHFVHSVEDHLFIVYPFVSGKIVPLNHLQETHAEIIGQLFANIHSCQLHHNISDPLPHYDVFDDDHWISIIKRYDHPELLTLLPTLLNWNTRFRSCIPLLNKETLISHRDLHCSNVLWEGYKPNVIDWESAGYTNPLQEIIGYGLEWAGIIGSQFNKELFFHMMLSYKKQIDSSNTHPEDAFFGWLGKSVMGWTEFNLRRSKEKGFDAQEQQRGADILDNTMIPCINFIAKNMSELLRNISR